VDRYTDFLTRAVLLARPWVRAGVLRLGQAGLASSCVLQQMAVRAGMLDTHYEASPLLRGEGRWVGRRAPDGAVQDPEGVSVRLLDLAGPDAALVLFDDGCLPGWNPAEVRELTAGVPRLRVVRIGPIESPEEGDYRDAAGALRKAWEIGAGSAALLRPDGIVGWMATRPSREALKSGVEGALGVNSS